jgi:hypothetical protein
MDYFFSKFLESLQRSLRSQIKTMSLLVTRVTTVIGFLQTERAELKAELATTKEQLVAALENDAADADAIAAAHADAGAARAAATEAAAKVQELQALADEDATEDAAINAVLDSVELPA